MTEFKVNIKMERVRMETVVGILNYLFEKGAAKEEPEKRSLELKDKKGRVWKLTEWLTGYKVTIGKDGSHKIEDRTYEMLLESPWLEVNLSGEKTKDLWLFEETVADLDGFYTKWPTWMSDCWLRNGDWKLKTEKAPRYYTSDEMNEYLRDSFKAHGWGPDAGEEG